MRKAKHIWHLENLHREFGHRADHAFERAQKHPKLSSERRRAQQAVRIWALAEAAVLSEITGKPERPVYKRLNDPVPF